MRERARERGIEVRDGTAEDLPYPDDRFDEVLMTTTLCYLDDPETMTEPDPVRKGHGEGGFVVLRGTCPRSEEAQSELGDLR